MHKDYQYEYSYNPEAIVAPHYKIPVMGNEFNLATAYVPYQAFYKVYEPMKGLMKGTIFPELYEPYLYKKSDR